MANRFLIRIAPDGELAWFAPATATRGRGAPPADLVAAASEVVALVPGEAVLVTAAELPKTSAAKLAKALPFALEDQLLDPVDDLHFALADGAGDGPRAVAVVARERLDGWLARLREAGVEADAVVPDCLALPLAGDAPTLLLDGDRCLVRLDATRGFVAAVDNLAGWLDDAARARRFRGFHAPDAAAPAIAGIAVEWQPAATSLASFAAGLGEPVAINLRQGDYAPRHRRAPERRLWRIAAVLALAALLLGLAGRIVDVVRLQHASASADAAIAKIYAASFPGSPPVPDPVARMQSELMRLGGSATGGGLMPLLTEVAPILATQSFRLKVAGIEYRNDTLELALTAPSLAILDQLRERLATLPGVSAELTAATPGDDGVQGRLRIHGAGA